MFTEHAAPRSHSEQLLPKAAPQSCCSSKQLFLRVVSGKLASKTCSPKRLPKAVVLQSNCSVKAPAAKPQRCSQQLAMLPNLFLKAVLRKLPLQSGCPEADSPKVAFPKYTPQRCSPKLRFFKAAVQSCSSKLLPKAVPLRCSTKLCPKLFSKAVAPKLRKAAPQSCCCPKLPAGLESCSKFTPMLAAQNCSPALLPKVVPQSCSPKLLP